MQCFKTGIGIWNEVLSYDVCPEHGKYPAAYRRWFGQDRFGISMIVAGCPECASAFAFDRDSYGAVRPLSVMPQIFDFDHNAPLPEEK